MKNQEMGPYKITKFFKAKETVKRTKWQPTNLEKIFTNPTSDRGLICNIYKELKKLDPREPNNPIKKWGMGLPPVNYEGSILVLGRQRNQTEVRKYNLRPTSQGSKPNGHWPAPRPWAIRAPSVCQPGQEVVCPAQSTQPFWLREAREI